VSQWLNYEGVYVIEDIKDLDVEKWKSKLEAQVDKYAVEYVDLTDTHKTEYNDSYLIIVRRIYE
jgi:hypothetical protein